MQPDLALGIDRNGQSWRGRHITIVGIGRSGMAAAALLRSAGAEVCVTDSRPAEVLKEELSRLAGLSITRIEVGGHTRLSLNGADGVVVSPGVGEADGPVAWAKHRSIPVISEIELAYLFCPAAIIAVTGTNGKSTAVTLIADILKATGRKAVACGNLGTPFCSIIPELAASSFAVVEVSSFQLLHCGQFRPKIGVLLNIGINHLDRHADGDAYLAAKARLFQAQTADDWAVLNGCDARMEALGNTIAAHCIWFGENRTNARAFHLAAQTLAALPVNVQAVLQVCRLLGIADPLACQIIRSFRGLEHRLESVDSIGGVHYVNDSKSTTPDSLLYALNRTLGSVVVIVGGRDKGMDFGSLVEPLRQARVKGVVLIGESRPRISRLLNGLSKIRECDTLEAAIKAAASLAGPGSTVLFSPACASFDMFRNFEDRGRAFKAIVQRMDDGVDVMEARAAVSQPAFLPANGIKITISGGLRAKTVAA